MIKFLDLQKITESFQPHLMAAIERVVHSGLFVKGHQVEKFEDAYASFIGTRFCVGVGNGFDALRLIFKAWLVSGELREGDEVIVPANTYIATILAVSENRLSPVFVEPDVETFNLSPENIEKKITSRTRAILVVHLYGRNGMSSGIIDIARRHNLKLVEDNAQAAGCCFGEARTGSLGHAAAHSFFPSKNLGALGDGGAVTTDDGALAELVRTLGHYGSHKKGVNDLQGVNSRLDEIQAAVLGVKLERLDTDNNRRRAAAERYLGGIRNPKVTLPHPPGDSLADEHVWHLFVIRCVERDSLQRHLYDAGIETMVHYPVPPHRQKAFHFLNDAKFPITEKIHAEVLSLPLSPALDSSELDAVVSAVNRFR